MHFPQSDAKKKQGLVPILVDPKFNIPIYNPPEMERFMTEQAFGKVSSVFVDERMVSATYQDLQCDQS